MGLVKVKKVNYLGWKNCVSINNGIVDVIITTDVGPRIIHYGFVDGPNHFKVFEEQKGQSGADHWLPYGGHRLWHSPEHETRTYDADNFTCEYEKITNGISIKSDMDPHVQVIKEMDITLDPKSTKVKILHKITNKNAWDIEFSVWGLSVMAKGGREIIPQITQGPKLLPNRTITLWTYTRMNDKRVSFLDEYIFLDQDSKAENPFKIGLPVPAGWAAYANHNQLFVKYFEHIDQAQYPDFGYCSYETYTNSEMLEMETLSPLWLTGPDEMIEHAEVWELFDNVNKPQTQEEVKSNILPLIEKSPKD